MSIKKTIGTLLQVPAWVLLAGSFFVGVYASIKHIQGVTWAVPIITFIIIGLYAGGRYLVKKERDEGE